MEHPQRRKERRVTIPRCCCVRASGWWHLAATAVIDQVRDLLDKRVRMRRRLRPPPGRFARRERD
jgi:hypothetical protein